MSSQPLHVEHRARYLPDYSMLIGCKCGVKFEPSDNDDAYAEHLASLERPAPVKRQQSQYLPRRKTVAVCEECGHPPHNYTSCSVLRVSALSADGHRTIARCACQAPNDRRQ